MIAQLRPGVEAQAKELAGRRSAVRSGRASGSTCHDVYLGHGAVVFVFEGQEVERRVAEVVNDPAASGSFSAWGPLLDGTPTIARSAYHWPD